MADRRDVIAKRLTELRHEVDVLSAEIRALEREDQELVVARCDHDWQDTGYEHGHNGDWEERWACKDCGHKVYEDPTK